MTTNSTRQYLFDYLKNTQDENPNFFYSIQGETSNVFWTDSTLRSNYTYFGDTVRIDTSYRSDASKMPFITFTGINHHAQPILFGCALLFNESENSFIWLIQTWLQAMSTRDPLSITTDPDRLVHMSVTQVVPQARHRFCRWGMFVQTEEKLASFYQRNPNFDHDFKNCVNGCNTIDDFESNWADLVGRYSLIDNEWMVSIYSIREQWVPVYMKDVFFGELFSTNPVNFFPDGLSSITTPMQTFIKQYEKSVSIWQENDVKADLDTSSTPPILKTPSPMEKQAANLYTKKIFAKFQEELVETLANPARLVEESGNVATYRVAKFGEDHKSHTVKFDAFGTKATCSCRMFEFSGIICRHVLSVFRTKNVLTLPSEYILERWTRNAKSGGELSAGARSPVLPSYRGESSNVCRGKLHQEAMKYVEEGAKSIHSYNVAMSALKDAGKRVAAVKSKIWRGAHVSNGGNVETNGVENQPASGLSKAEKEKKIHELTAELDRTNQKCEVYRAILLALFKETEEQKLKLSVKVQNARITLKE